MNLVRSATGIRHKLCKLDWLIRIESCAFLVFITTYY